MAAENKPRIHRCHHQAMATTFEIQIAHADETYARQAARAAFDEVDRLEALLSRYIDHSDISQINRLAPGEFTPVHLDTFACLQWSREMYKITRHTFDITLGTLYEHYKTPHPSPDPPNRMPSRMDHLVLREEDLSVGVTGEGISLDLGGIGKGFAVDFIADILREWNIAGALINGGYSSLRAVGTQPDGQPWQTTLRHPRDQTVLETRPLHKQAFSGSGVQKGCHIIDPRTGRPAPNNVAAWAIAPQAVMADALSTAFMILPWEDIEEVCCGQPSTGAMVIIPDTPVTKCFGRWHNRE